MTVASLDALYRTTNEGALCILVRDGFFSTITKCDGVIFEFVTAESTVDEDPQTTWRTLLSVEAVGSFTNNKFEVLCSDREHSRFGDDDNAENIKQRMPFIRDIKRRLNERLLSLKEDRVHALKRTLF